MSCLAEAAGGRTGPAGREGEAGASGESSAQPAAPTGFVGFSRPLRWLPQPQVDGRPATPPIGCSGPRGGAAAPPLGGRARGGAVPCGTRPGDPNRGPQPGTPTRHPNPAGQRRGDEPQPLRYNTAGGARKGRVKLHGGGALPAVGGLPGARQRTPLSQAVFLRKNPFSARFQLSPRTYGAHRRSGASTAAAPGYARDPDRPALLPPSAASGGVTSWTPARPGTGDGVHRNHPGIIHLTHGSPFSHPIHLISFSCTKVVFREV